jgi:hypothetical protein
MAKAKKSPTKKLTVKRATVKDLRTKSSVKGGVKAPKKV